MICVIGIINDPIWFEYDGSSGYLPCFGALDTLTRNAGTLEFIHQDPFGRVTKFYDFSAGNPQALRGKFKEFINPYGVSTYPSYNSDHEATEFVRSSGPNTDAFYYNHCGSGDPNVGKIEYVTREVDGGDVERTVFEYYGSSDDNGSLGDLKEAEIQRWDGAAWITIAQNYYRYWKAGQTNGVEHGMKFVLGAEACARMIADGLDPETATNTQVASYADFYFEYDSDRRITLEITNAGTQTFEFEYTTSSFSPGTDPYNRWQTKTVETLPSGAQNIVFSNFFGQTMLKIFKSGSDQWYDFYVYDEDGRQILHAESSAVTGFDETKADLLNKVSGNYQYLSDNSGLLHVSEYYSSTDLPSGAVEGMLRYEKVQKGENGTPIKLREFLYTSQSGGGRTIYPTWKEIQYRNDASGGSDPVTTEYDYTWYTDTVQVKIQTTMWPAIPTSQNGSGTSNSRSEYFDEWGQRTWLRDESGFLTNFTFDLSTGGLLQKIEDVDTSILPAPSGTGWTTPAGGGLHLITDYEIDSQGRMTQELGPTHTVDIAGTATSIRRAKWVVYLDEDHARYEGQGYATGSSPSYTYTLINPVQIIQEDYDGRTIDEISATRASTSGRLTASDSFPQSSWVRWTHTNYNTAGLRTFQRVYFAIPSSGSGTSSNYNQTDFGYDGSENLIRRKSPAGTIARTVYDVRNQPIEEWIGTDDTGATPTNPAGSGSPNNMVKVSANEYDNGAAGGDGNLTKTTQYESTSSTRVTNFGYDFRDRRISTTGELGFYEESTYDNVSRVIETRRKDIDSSGTLLSKSTTLFDDLGRVYQRLQYSVESGAAGNSLKEKLWYSPTGQTIKQVPIGTQGFDKTQYDSIGRISKTFRCFDFSEADTNYSAAQTVTGDTVLQQSEKSYDNASNLIQSTNRDRFHDATGTGELTSPSGSQPKARVSYVASYPDPIGRVRATANYGTNGGSSFSRPTTVPSRSDTVLVQSTAYNNDGEPFETTDPAGTITHQDFDDAGRRMALVEDYGTGRLNRTTQMTYTPDDQLATLTSQNAVTGNQVTTWTYGTTLSDSDAASNDLLRFKQFPDGSSTDRMEYKYNRQGQVKEVKDQLGTVRALDYDKLGRPLHDRVTTAGSGVDTAVLRISRAYESRGLLETLASHDNATVGSGSIVNEIKYEYDGFMLLTKESQSHQGAVASNTPSVGYNYTNGSSNHARRTGILYPDQTLLEYHYGETSGAGDAFNRTQHLQSGSSMGVDYCFLGFDRTVIDDYSCEPSVELTYYTPGGSGDAGDQYTGLDRFGRVIDQRWRKTSDNSDKERVKYGFDRASNRVWRQNTVAATGQDEYYTYDGLYEIKSLQRGTLNAGKTGITGTPSWQEDWNYDPLGNWNENATPGMAYRTKVSGTTTLNQNRTHNVANEITDITETAGTAWPTPVQNAVGNMTSIPQPLSLGNSFDLKWDAWNRLVQIKSGPAFIAGYAYDGANRRVTKLTATEFRHYYYSDQWQIIEERLNGTENANRRFFWGMRYVDDLICRDRGSERLYALHDFFNITTVVDVNGDVQERYGYDGFGAVRYMTPSFADRPASDYAWETLYAAYRYDQESGLYQVRNRYAHYTLGRWLIPDPIGNDASSNLYAYVDNSPISFIDSFGLATNAAPADPSLCSGCTESLGMFTLTVYNVAAESDFLPIDKKTDKLYHPKGLDRLYSFNFMKEVDLQGTGVNVEGKFIKLIDFKSSPFTYKYVDSITGKSGRTLIFGTSIAVDPGIIPLGMQVCIKGYGIRRADDTGTKIKGKRIDLFENVSKKKAMEFGTKTAEVFKLPAPKPPSKK